MLNLSNKISSNSRTIYLGQTWIPIEVVNKYWQELTLDFANIWEDWKTNWTKKFSKTINWENNLSDTYGNIHYTNWN